ncbi:MAG: glycosyltransferase [Bacteroidales bacterium]|nr:glycosyltransferase [Bacteroidales bacterium]
MKNENISYSYDTNQLNDIISGTIKNDVITNNRVRHSRHIKDNRLPEILFITSFPPRECGIATYSQDLINTIDNKFGHSFSIKICALESKDEKYQYDDKVCYVLDTSISAEYAKLADKINQNERIKIIVIQHEFGFFQLSGGNDFLNFLNQLIKPVILVFHTVLPRPDERFREMVKNMVAACKSVIVMTNTSKGVLEQDYGIPQEKIEVIAHGTHLVSNNNKTYLKKKYGLKGHKILSTFGLLSSGKSIETTLDALPAIIKTNPEVIFLAIGKTHPGVIKSEGEKYRQMLEEKVISLKIEKHVKFVNQYLDLPVLLEYLRLTDIYLFTSKDPNQAVSGTFSYAMSCGCPIISTPIAQAREMLDEHTGIVIEFQHSQQLAAGVMRLLKNDSLRKDISLNTLHKIAPTAWENSAVAHGLLFEKTLGRKFSLRYSTPAINLNHIKQLTTDYGMIQFSKINQPDIGSGYTLDDNARALIAICMHYELTQEKTDLDLMNIYLHFIKDCIQPDGTFLNYVDEEEQFTSQNTETNLEDANGRAIWALGFLISRKNIIPPGMIEIAEELIEISAPNTVNMFSSRAMAFNIKGLYYYNREHHSPSITGLIEILADRLAAMYEHESENKWNWFESYLTYANSILPEAMLFAWLSVKKLNYLIIAKKSFDFLLSQTFDKNEIKVISNRSWLSKGGEREYFGEQPIDVSYTILALHAFHRRFKNEEYLKKLKIAFNWFLGNNHLQRIIYNPCTGGCYDGLEEHQVNLNQGAESTVSYLMARLTIEKYKNSTNLPKTQSPAHVRVHTKERKCIYSSEYKG